MIPKHVAEAVLKAALSSGGDFAEIYAEDQHSSTATLQSGKIEQVVSGREHGAGIRVFLGTRTVYAYTNDTSLKGLTDTALKAAAAIGAVKEGREVTLAPSKVSQISPILLPPSNIEVVRKTDMLKEACFAAKEYDPLIAQVTGTLLEKEKNVLICNSEGLYAEDSRTHVRISISAIASMGGENQVGAANPGAQTGYELFEGMDLKALGIKSAKQAVTMLKAPACPAGVMPVVIDNGFGGVLFHEACGHSLEATSVSKGTSQFSGKLGQKIASSIVTAIDDGTIPNAWGSLNIDDEGFTPRKNVLIKDGVLQSYMIDRLGSRRMGMDPTGSSRRESYKYAATSRMTNTYIAPGNDDDAEIISSMGDGLYCKAMGGGSVNPTTGEFNFSVREAYLVKDGKITTPVRGASLIGKGDQVLPKIDRVGKNMTMEQGMCGSQSGSIPANVGQPMIRISSITVGGR